MVNIKVSEFNICNSDFHKILEKVRIVSLNDLYQALLC